MPRQKILFVAANPTGTSLVHLDREVRAIQREIARSKHRERFSVETRWAAQPLDLLQELRVLKPTIVHFAGHGGGTGLAFEGPDGDTQWVSAQGLADAFSAAGRSVKVVLLNACHSEQHARLLAVEVDFVVAMAGAIHDSAARSFSVGFYGALAENEPVEVAWRQGCAAISLQGLPGRELPQLLSRANSKASILNGVRLERPERAQR